MENYNKLGYLSSDFKLFHITDKGQKEFDFHYHDFDKLVILMAGDVSYTVEGRTYPLQPYDIVLIRHNEIHRPVIHSDEPYERIIVYISPEFMKEYQTDTYDLASCFDKASEAKTSVLRIPSLKHHPLYKAVRELEASLHDKEYASELYQKVTFLEFMIHLNRAVLKDSLHYLHDETANGRILEILEYINENLTADFSIDDLANRFFISKYYMMRTFKNETGFSIGNYILQKRLVLARKKIADGAAITQVCYQCGFKDYSNFSKQYKKFFGMTPKESR